MIHTSFPNLFLPLVLAGMTSSLIAQTTLQEGFETWPPSEWTLETLGAGIGFIQDWQGLSSSGSHSAYAAINNSNCDHWMVTPAIEIANDAYQLTFAELNQSSQYYDNRSVWISAGSGVPGNADFELIWTDAELPGSWTEQTVSLEAYAGETVFVAWRYQGTWHEWFIDDVTIAPASFADAALTNWSAPSLFSPAVEAFPLELTALNLGTTTIQSAYVEWSVNSEPGTIWNGSDLNWLPGEELTIDLGYWTPAGSGYHVLTAEIDVADDYEPGNNSIGSTHDISTEKDITILQAQPEGMQPVVSGQSVFLDIQNTGAYTVDTLEVSWSVDGMEQPLWSTLAAGIEPAQASRVAIGTVDLEPGVHELTFHVHALGDPLWPTQTKSTSVQVNVLYESFEGGNIAGMPENWSTVYGLVEGTNFGLPHDGDWYYTAMPDENYFGVVFDTLWSPPLVIEDGDEFSFYIKTSDFLATANQVVLLNLETGVESVLGNVIAPPNNYQNIALDLSNYPGIYRVGVTSTVDGNPGFCRFDLFQSSAQPWWPEFDLNMHENEPFYQIPTDVPWSHSCSIKNTGLQPVLGSDYTVHLLQSSTGVLWDTLQTVPGQDCASWEEVFIPITHTWSETASFQLKFALEFSGDENPANNASLATQVQAIDETAIRVGGPAPGLPIVPSLNMPFNAMGNSLNLGEDDLSYILFRPQDLEVAGTLHGLALHFQNLLFTEQTYTLPVQISVQPTSSETLLDLELDPLDFQVIAQDTVAFQSGFDRWVYIPFDTPIVYSGLESLVFRFYQYDPTWPPAVLRCMQVLSDDPGTIRANTAMDVYQLDPNEVLDFGYLYPDFPDLRFISLPEASFAPLAGTVVNEATQAPIANATVTIAGTSLSATTDSEGAFSWPELPLGNYAIEASRIGYASETWEGSLAAEGLDLTLELPPLPLIELSGVIVADDQPTLGLSGVSLSCAGDVLFTAESDADGSFSFEGIWGESNYSLSAELFGYEPGMWEPIDVFSESVNLDTLVLNRSLLSPYDARVNWAGSASSVQWKHPWTGRSNLRSLDTDFVSSSYTNEPFENVWLGNRFEFGEDTATALAIEVHFDLYENATDFVTVELLDQNGNELCKSEPFLALLDTTVSIPIPRIPVYGTVYAMLHWQDNPISTNALCVEFSENITQNVASIAYPDSPPMLLSDYFGGGPDMAFHLRLLTWDDFNFDNQPALAYHLKRGLQSTFPDVSTWDWIATGTPDTTFIDESIELLDEAELYRYAVQAEYPTGLSAWTFTDPWSPNGGNAVAETPVPNGQASIQPTLLSVGQSFTLRGDGFKSILVFDEKGRECVHIGRTNDCFRSVSTRGWSAGIYSIQAVLLDGTVFSGRVVLTR